MTEIGQTVVWSSFPKISASNVSSNLAHKAVFAAEIVQDYHIMLIIPFIS